MRIKSQLLLACSIMLAVGVRAGIDITPDFGAAPTGWFTDRYEPTSFGNVGTYQGRDNVLGIGISSAGNLANRPTAYQSSFYNTQGRQYAVAGGAGSVLSADLYIPTSWSDPLNGNVRTDMWGVMSDVKNVVTGYPIIGFSNYGGPGRFRIYDGDLGGWVNLGASISYNSWNTLAIEFTGTSFVFSVNGNNVYTDSTIGATAGFSAVIMQAYNFADAGMAPGAVLVDYTAHWSNTAAVPEPSTVVAGALLLLPFGVSALRRLGKSRKA
jgi:hypothetical protein